MAVNHAQTLESTGAIKIVAPDNSTSTPTMTTDNGGAAAAAVNVNSSTSHTTDPDDHSCEIDALLDVYITTSDVDPEYTFEEDILDGLAVKLYKRYPRARTSSKCYYCGKPGHVWMKCYSLLSRLQSHGYRASPRRMPPKQDSRSPRQPTLTRAPVEKQNLSSRKYRQNKFKKRLFPTTFKKRGNQKFGSFLEMVETYLNEEVDDSDSDSEEEEENKTEDCKAPLN